MSITRSGDRWRVRVYVGVDPKTGKKRFVDKIVSSEREAKRLEASIRQQVVTNTYVPPASETLGDFLTRWLETEVKPNVREGTYERYREAVHLYIKPILGRVRIDKLTPYHVSLLLAQMHKAGKSVYRRRLVYQTLHRALQVAIEWQLVGRNVCDAVRPPRVTDKARVGLSLAQLQAFLKTAERHRLYPLFLLAVTTGMRRGELFGLRWEDINPEEGYLVVRRALRRAGRDPLFEPPKNGKERVVPLEPEVLKALWAWKVQQEIERATARHPYKDNGYVFTHKDGKLWDPHNFSRRTFKALLSEAGLPATIRFHDLRHTFVSRALQAGANPRAVSEIVGHHSPSFTLHRYGHVLSEDIREAARRVVRYLGGDEVGTGREGNSSQPQKSPS